MNVGHRSAIVPGVHEVELARRLGSDGRALHVRVERHPPRERDVALQQLGDVLHGKVGDRQVEVCATRGGQQAIGIDASSATTAQLEVHHLDAARAPSHCRRVRGLPGRRVEVERDVGQPQFVPRLVEREVAIERVVARIPLPDPERQRAVRLEVIQGACQAVEGEAERADRVTRQRHGHLGARRPRIRPAVRGREVLGRVATHDESRAGRRARQRKPAHRAGDRPGPTHGAREDVARDRARRVYLDLLQLDATDCARHLGGLVHARRVFLRALEPLRREARTWLHDPRVRTEPRQEVRECGEGIDGEVVGERAGVARVQPEGPCHLDPCTGRADKGAIHGGDPVREPRLHRRRIHRDRVERGRPEAEVQVRHLRGRLEATPTRRASSRQRCPRHPDHHAAEVECGGVGHHVVAQLLREEVHRAAHGERTSSRQ